MLQKMDKNQDGILISKYKLINVGLLITIFNPLPAGLIYSFVLWRQPELKKDGRLMMVFSLLWGAISLALAQKYLGY